MKFVDTLIKNLDEKVNGTHYTEAVEFLKKHKRTLESVGLDQAKKYLAQYGIGHQDEALDALMIMQQPPSQLIDNVKSSAAEFEKAHRKAQEHARKLREMQADLTAGAARFAASLLVSLI